MRRDTYMEMQRYGLWIAAGVVTAFGLLFTPIAGFALLGGAAVVWLLERHYQWRLRKFTIKAETSDLDSELDKLLNRE